MTPVEPRLEIGFARVGSTELQVHYAITNTSGDRAIFAFVLNRDRYAIRHEKPPPLPTDDFAQTFFAEPDVLHLWLGRVPIPEGIDVYRPRTPRALRLAPEEKHEALLHVPIPICEWSDYFEPGESPEQSMPVRTLQLEVEYVFEDEAFEIQLENEILGIYFVLGLPRRTAVARADIERFRLEVGLHPSIERHVPQKEPLS